MKRSRLIALAGAVAVAAIASPSAAPAGEAATGERPNVVLSVDVKQEISKPDARGNVTVVRKAAEHAGPGDVLVYTLTYTNAGGAPANGARVDDPIPAGTVLVPASVAGQGATVTFSIDGGKTFTTWPATVTEPGPDGKPRSREADAEMYTHIRWTARDPLGPGESRSASFKVIVR